MFKLLMATLLVFGLMTSNASSNEATTVQGKVKAFHESPKGDIDGITLADGAQVRFPPHVGKQVRAIVDVGDEIRATVEKHVTPKGDEHLRAEQITNVKSGKSVACDVPPEKKAKPDSKPAPKPDPKAASGKKPHPAGPKGEPKHEPPHEQIISEIRALRALVGGGTPPKDEAAGEGREAPPHERILAELKLLRAQLERKK